MHVSCPDCATSYQVPDARLKPGRLLRCAECGRQWAPVEAAPPAPAPAPTMPPPPIEEPAEPVVPARLEPPPAPATAPDQAAELAEKPAAASPAPLSGAQPTRTAPALQAPAMVERAVRLMPPEHPRMHPWRQSVLPLALAWALTVAVVTAGGWGAYQYKNRVIRAWPPSERAYAALGLD